jgi:hypothetical protein
MAKRDPNLWDTKIERKGRSIFCKWDIVGHIPKVIFRRRYAGHWDVAAHDRAAAEQYKQYAEMERNMRRAGAEAARKRAAPHDDDVLLRGKLGIYWRSDFARLDELEQETRQKIDSTLAERGFQHVGDFVAKAKRDILMRGYISDDKRTYAILKAKRSMYLGVEFYSRFADGSRLTTAPGSTTNSRPELQYYIKECPGLDTAALYEKHRWSIDRFGTHKGTSPVPLASSLAGVAWECDQALARRECTALQIRLIAPPPSEAPDEIRAAWVGCVVPLFATTDDPRVSKQAKSVLSRQDEEPPQGFAVRVLEAIRALESHNPQAAQWWREHTPHLMQPGQLFGYPAEVCELVDDSDEFKTGDS